MNPALQDRSTELSTLCRRHHVRRLSVFGSAARDEMRTDSDVATPAILRNPYRRQAIVGDLQQLYAA
jgi:predicted nucleotidyltransferase